MATHKALVLKGFDIPMSLETIPKPVPGAGEVVVKVLGSHVVPVSLKNFSAKRPNGLVLPMVPGGASIGRVDSIGPDTVSLSPGQLVFIDSYIRARDNPDESILLGFNASRSEASRKLMDGVWRDGTLAEFAKLPLENVYPLDEHKLLKEHGYSLIDIPAMHHCLIAFGGLRDAGLQAGDTIIVAPSTSNYGAGAVVSALAMGAKVIAAKETLQPFVADSFGSLASKIVEVKLVGDVEKDTAALKAASGPKGADVYIDFSEPGNTNQPTHIKACLDALRPHGVVSLMGGFQGEISLPYFTIKHKNIKIRGNHMYKREDVLQLIKLLENGNLVLGKRAGVEVVGEFKLEQIEEAMELSAEKPGWRYAVTIGYSE